MSLKAIHIVFIVASLAMTLFFAVWSWRTYFGPEGTSAHLAYGVFSILAIGGLLYYGQYFLKKLKHISYL